MIADVRYYDLKEDTIIHATVSVTAVAYAEKDKSISINTQEAAVTDFGPEHKAEVVVYADNGTWLNTYNTK